MKISFRNQFKECKESNMVESGKFVKWSDHPEFLPLPWSRAAKLITEELKVNPNAGIKMLSCLRFSGDCSSDNERCRKMRGL